MNLVSLTFWKTSFQLFKKLNVQQRGGRLKLQSWKYTHVLKHFFFPNFMSMKGGVTTTLKFCHTNGLHLTEQTSLCWPFLRSKQRRVYSTEGEENSTGTTFTGMRIIKKCKAR